MYIPRRRKTRLKMGLMIAISSLSISALAASTMAWYSVNTSITVNSSTVSIRTALQYHFYAFKDNGFTYNTSTHTYASGSGYATLGNDHTLDDINDYEEVNELADYDHKTDLVTALTKVSGLWPGYKMSFAVRVDGLQNGDQPSLTLNPALINPGLANDRAGLTRDNGKAYVYRVIKDSDPLEYIRMVDAIKLSAGSAGELDDAVSYANGGSPVAPGTAYRNYNENGEITMALFDAGNPISLGQSTNGGNDNHSWWYFFTIQFSNHSSTYYHLESTDVEKDGEGKTIGYIERYTKSGSGNSSCYEGLPFSLGTMDLK